MNTNGDDIGGLLGDRATLAHLDSTSNIVNTVSIIFGHCVDIAIW